MRIAVCGSHRTGKSTLIDELSTLLPEHETIDEPYHVMVEDGYDFCHPPSVDDYQAQLERSIESLSDDGDDVLFDRCPVDFLGYISTREDADVVDLDEWLPRIRVAVQTLEAQDRIAFSPSDDDEEMRATVDERLREILLDNSLNLAVEVLEVEGETEWRARTVMARVRRGLT